LRGLGGIRHVYYPCGLGAINRGSKTIKHALFSFFGSGRRYHIGKPRKAQVALSR
jgi:hypothetical protein